MENSENGPNLNHFSHPPAEHDVRALTDQQRFELAPMGLKFKIIHEQFEWLMQQEFRSDNVTCSQMSVLRYLVKNQDHKISQKELCSALHVTHPTMVGILQRMREKGLIEQAVDPENHRFRVISLSAAGQSLVRKNLGRREEKDALLIRGMSKDEITQLQNLLQKVHNNLGGKMEEVQSRSEK